MKTIAIMQPVYMPWLGYFEQMAVCDEFMFLDDVQYTKHDWRNRNKIRTKEGWMWLTIPIWKAKLDKNLQETTINYDTQWARKHLRAINASYAPSPFYKDVIGIMEAAFDKKPERLIDLTVPLVLSFANYLKIGTPISFASQFPRVSDDRHERIVELCRARSAEIVYTGPAAKSYANEDYLLAEGVNIVFQDYEHPVYEQHFEGFESHMAIIDLLMNHGPNAREILLSSRLPKEFVIAGSTNV